MRRKRRKLPHLSKLKKKRLPECFPNKKQSSLLRKRKILKRQKCRIKQSPS